MKFLDPTDWGKRTLSTNKTRQSRGRAAFARDRYTGTLPDGRLAYHGVRPVPLLVAIEPS